MAKRKRLTPARLDAGVTMSDPKTPFSRYSSQTAPGAVSGTRPPIADVAHDAAASAALSEVAQTLSDARAEGRLIQALSLDLIDADFLVRDRIAVDGDEMVALIESLSARGQQAAIEVTALDNGRYGLISGWRRLTALRAMQADGSQIETVLAIIRQSGDAAEAYLAMVEENEIRVGLSYYERARIVARAVDKEVYKTDRLGLQALFHAASRPKRSKIGSFVRIVRALDATLTYPTAMTERTGLALAQALNADAGVAKRIEAALQSAVPASAEAETATIARVLRPKAPVAPRPAPQALRPGLTLTTQANDRIVLQGEALKDDDFRTALMQFLAAD